MRGRARLSRRVTVATLYALSWHALAKAEDPVRDTDLVETIDAMAAPESAATAQAPSTPPLIPVRAAPSAKSADGDRFELHGWARQSSEIGLSKPAKDPPVSEATTLLHDQLTVRSQLFMRARYSHEHWFEANVSGALSYALFEQAPADAGTQFNGFNGRSARGVIEPELHELFVGFFTGPLDVRIGQQRVAWGNTDFMSPNDVVNPRDLRDPFLNEAELRRLPTLMLRADLDLGFATLQGVVAPVYTPDRYDVYGSNWAGIQPDAPAWARGLANLATRSFDPTLQESAQRLLMATRYPKGDLSEPVLAARLGWSTHGLDIDYYYQYGFDGPRIRVDPAFVATVGAIDFDHAGLADLQPLLVAIDAGGRPLEASYVRRHHLGTDIGTTLGPVALRLDAAYESKGVFFQRDLVGWVSPTVHGVFSAEYQTGDKNKFALLELLYLRLVDAPTIPLLLYRRDSMGVGADLRWPLWHPLGFGLRGMFGIIPQSLVMQPELNLKFERWTLSGGVLWLDGEAYSLGGHFRRNLESFVKLKWFF
jgi:hypothetical protein